MATATGLTPSTLNPADIAGAISSYYGVASGDAAVATLVQVILPDIQSATARDAVSWKSVFPSVLAKYEKMAKDLGLGVSPQQREIDAAKNANPTGAGWAGFEWSKLADTRRGTLPLALREESETRSSGERATASSLSRSAPLNVDGAISYARELGMSPALAGFFVGGSAEMRDALRNAITKGSSISDDQVTSMKDVGMVLGAIRAGKLKADDPRLPPSVKSMIDDMKKQGIDPATADPKKIQKYLKDNPAALEATKRAVKRDVAALPADQRQSANDAIEKAKGATTNPASAPKMSSKLNLTPAG